MAKPADTAYEPDKRVMFKLKHERTADCVVAGYRTHKNDRQAIGSLLLGINGRSAVRELFPKHRPAMSDLARELV